MTEYKTSALPGIKTRVYVIWDYAIERQISFVMSQWELEWQWFQSVRRVRTAAGALCYLLENIYIPQQECSTTGKEVESSGFSLTPMYKEIMDDVRKSYPDPDNDTAGLMDATNKRINSVTAWCHSHVNMPTAPSITDEDTFRDMIEMNAKAGNNNPIVMLILNRKGEIYTRIYDPEFGVEFENAIFHVSMPKVDMTTAEDALNTKLTKKKEPAKSAPGFTPATPTTPTVNGGVAGTNLGNGYRPAASSGANSGQQSTTAGSTVGTTVNGSTALGTHTQNWQTGSHQSKGANISSPPKKEGEVKETVLATREAYGVTVIKKAILSSPEETTTQSATTTPAYTSYKPTQKGWLSTEEVTPVAEVPETVKGITFSDDSMVQLVGEMNRRHKKGDEDVLKEMIEASIEDNQWGILHQAIFGRDDASLYEAVEKADIATSNIEKEETKLAFFDQYARDIIDPAQLIVLAISFITHLNFAENPNEARLVVSSFLVNKEKLIYEFPERRVTAGEA
jgi:hypothetical protein